MLNQNLAKGLETQSSLQDGEESAVDSPRVTVWEQLKLMSSFISDLDKGLNSETGV